MKILKKKKDNWVFLLKIIKIIIIITILYKTIKKNEG